MDRTRTIIQNRQLL